MRMAMAKLMLPILLLCWFLSGCAATAPVEGPHLDLLPLTGRQVEQRLGKPASINEEFGNTTWTYPQCGLDVVFYHDRVMQVMQTRGRLTEQLRIGDTEEQVVALFGPMEKDVETDGLVKRIYQGGTAIVVYVRDGHVVKGEILIDGGDD